MQQIYVEEEEKEEKEKEQNTSYGLEGEEVIENPWQEEQEGKAKTENQKQKAQTQSEGGKKQTLQREEVK